MIPVLFMQDLSNLMNKYREVLSEKGASFSLVSLIYTPRNQILKISEVAKAIFSYKFQPLIPFFSSSVYIQTISICAPGYFHSAFS